MNFFKANLWHDVITCDRDPQTGLYNEGVGTFNYKVFANETVMIARSMDMRGSTSRPSDTSNLLHFQGQEALTGRYTTKEGVFHSARSVHARAVRDEPRILHVGYRRSLSLHA